MTDSICTFPVGGAIVSVINVGDILAPLTTWMDPPPGGWSAAIAPIVTPAERFPINCIHITLPGLLLLVDAGLYVEPDAEHAIPAYHPPPDLLAALASIGIQPADVTHIVITHTHGDHFNGLTRERDGVYHPVFPHARCFLGRGDWDRPEMQTALQDPASLESQTLGVISRAGLLELVSGDLDLGGGAQIIATPGETPGHQMVRVQSGGSTLYCVGDLMHHPLEIEQPQYMVRWAEPKSTLASRQALSARALGEDALIVATHIAAAGRLVAGPSGVRWQSAAV